MPAGVRTPPAESPARRARYSASHRTTSRSGSPPRPPRAPRAPPRRPEPVWCGSGRRAPTGRDAARAIPSRFAPRDALGERRQPRGVRLGLRFERVRDEGVRREQVERQLAPGAWPIRYPPQHAPSQEGELVRQRRAGGELRVGHRPLEADPQRVRGDRAARLEPGKHLASGHRRSSPSMIARVWARARPSFAASPAPAEAKCGRPPPFPPDTAAIALAMSPALTPCCTRSSVTETCTPARSPFVNSTEIARLWLERNASMTSPI